MEMDEKALERIVNQRYSKKVGFADLMEMIHGELRQLEALTSDKQTLKELKGAKARERILRLPSVIPTEITVGQKPNSTDRRQFEIWMSNIGMEGGADQSNVAKKISTITSFFDNLDTNLENASTPQLLSYLMFLNQFVWMLKEFNASVAGFLWEPFLAALFGGKSRQVPTSEGDIADIQIDTGKGMAPISLKILNEVGGVKGSFTDLADHFAAGGTEMRYVVVTKQQSSKEKAVSSCTFYEFNVTAENFFDWIGNVHFVEKLQLATQKFSLADAGNKSFLKMGSSSKAGDKGNYVWIRHAVGGKQTSRGVMMGATSKWLRLALIDPKKGVVLDPKTQEEIGLQGVPEDGTLDTNTSLSAEIAVYGAGGRKGGKKSVAGATVKTDYVKFEKAPGMFDDTKYTKMIWGKEGEQSGINYWSGLAQQLNDPKAFFTAVQGRADGIPPAPGYAAGKDSEAAQFNIKPLHYKNLGTKLGVLRITEKAVQDAFQKSAERMNEDLVIMFNALADLTDNIGRFFLTDCGGNACTEADMANRNAAGQNAIENADELERAVMSSVKRESRD
tara:strand:- start:5723 stop:7405 length:1683 start_codon:yes stop_codon:yes gene_type:complete